MKVGVVGSRGLNVDISKYIPAEASELISGGASGVDTLAEQYARERGLPAKVFLPNTKLLGKHAYFARNDQIVDAADMIVAIWDGKSRGTYYTIKRAMELNKPVKIYIIKSDGQVGEELSNVGNRD
ncbi:DUF2493 domain-containing protein [Eubacteriales bacterium OttesenSCG-928-K08]|nr:DUF2493 domain-containing protein [Eubacteriales bacterium OttesenSCG-928-K08]